MTDILINQIQTPDGTIIRSHHRHDYVSYTDKNGNTYSVDGGKEYLKRGFTIKDYFELSILEYDSFEKIRLYWKLDNDIYLCDLDQSELDRQLSKIPELDKYYLKKSYQEKTNYVIHVSLLLQERLYRKKFQNYNNQLKELLLKYKKDVGTLYYISSLLINEFHLNLKDPFWKCKYLINTSQYGHPCYHQILKLIWEQLSKYEWLKGNEYETERVLNMVLKPLEE